MTAADDGGGKPVTLTARQLAWCKQNIRAFGDAWRDVQKAEAPAAKVYERMGVERGAVGAGADGADQP